MKKNGFTLIELLAVIVILAIIALIATPIVLNIIEESKESATIRGAEYYMDAVELGIIRARLDNTKVEDGIYNILTNGNICNQNDITNEVCNEGKEITIEVKGEIPDSGTVTITNGKLENEFLKYDNNVITKVDNEFVIVPKPESFATDTWDTIIANVKAGNISIYEDNIGMEKTITLTSADAAVAGSYKVRLANTSTPTECKSSGFSQTACGFVIEFVDIIYSSTMYFNNTYGGGWPSSLVIRKLNDTLNTVYVALPTEVRNSIINTYVVSGYEQHKKENYETEDYLYLLSTKEVFGTLTEDNDTVIETRKLDYYSGTEAIRIKSLNGTATEWWLRSADSENSNYFFSIDNAGKISGKDAGHDSNIGVSPAFRIG